MKKYTWLILLPLSLFIIIAIAVAIQQEKVNQIRCALTMGRWETLSGPVGAPNFGGSCYHPPQDEGAACYQNSECERDCIYTTNKDSEGYILGSCGEYSILRCTPTIPAKTKSTDTLQGGSCV